MLLWTAQVTAQDQPPEEEAWEGDAGIEEEAPPIVTEPEPEEGPEEPVVESSTEDTEVEHDSKTATAEQEEKSEEEAPQEKEKSEDKPSEAERWFGGDFMDTRVTFVFSDNNVLAGPKDSSPGVGADAPDNEFYENLQTEKTGYETETELVLYKRMPSYFHRLDAEAALVLELQSWVDDQWQNEVRIGDNGSYLKLNFYTKRDDFEGDNISLTMFPMDSQRFLLGYTYDITWGGEKIFPNNSGQVPGARLKYDFNVKEDHQGYVFAGFKTANLYNGDISERQTYYGVLAGFGVGITRFLNWEMNGGYFQRGSFDRGSELDGQSIDAFGGSTRLALHQGIPVKESVDFRLYKNTPEASTIITDTQEYDGGISWSLSGEFTTVAQTLLLFEDMDDSKMDPAKAAGVNGRFLWGNARFHADFIYRDLSYVLFNVPGFIPYVTTPRDADVVPEWFIALGVDYFFKIPRLTPGLVFAYKQPAMFSVDTDNGVVNVVVRDENDRETMPIGENAYDIIAAKATLKWDVAPFFAVVGELRYTLDNNKTKYKRMEEETGLVREFDEKHVTNRLGFSFLAQAKF